MGGRPILLDERMAQWHFSRGYVENVSAAIALAIENNRSAGEVYNVADSETLPEEEWVRAIGKVVAWKGDVVSAPQEALPQHLQTKTNWEQDWEVDTAKIREQLGYNETHWSRRSPPAHRTLGTSQPARRRSIRTTLTMRPKTNHCDAWETSRKEAPP